MLLVFERVTKLARALAIRSLGFRFGLWLGRWLGFALNVEYDGGADKILQRGLIDLVAFVDIDGAPDISIQAGVEQTRRVFQ